MKRIFLPILALFISFLVFSLDVKAEEDFDFTCEYKISEENVTFKLRFNNNPDNKYIESYSGKEKTGGSINSDGSSFSEIVYADVETSGIQKYATYAGKNFVIDNNFNSEKFKVSEGVYSCPDIAYTKYGYEYEKIPNVMVIRLLDSTTCQNYTCHNIEKLTQVIYDPSQGGAVELEEVSFCTYDIRNNRSQSNVTTEKLKFTSYSDGSVKVNIKGKTTTVDLNSSDVSAFDIFVNYNSPMYTMTSADLKSIISLSADNKLTCTGTLFSYHDNVSDRIVLTSSIDNIPNGYKDEYNQGEISDSNNSNIVGPIGGNVTKPSDTVNSSCSAYLGVAGAGDNLATFLDNIWGIIKVGSILLVIVFSMFDFSKAVTNDKEKIPEVVKKSVLRLVFLVVILLLPTLIDAIGKLAGVDNILCGIK